jgi:glycerophosphoryl diester phosphodiesterase
VRSLRLADGTSPPLFREVLDLVAGRVPLYVEIKNRHAPGRLEARVLTLLAGYAGPFAVASFNPWVLAWFRKRAPAIPRGQIACAFRGERMAAYKKYYYRNLLLNFVTAPDFIAYDLRDLPNRAVDKARARGLPVLAWTVRTPGDLAKARACADNFVFEGIEPDLLDRA